METKALMDKMVIGVRKDPWEGKLRRLCFANGTVLDVIKPYDGRTSFFLEDDVSSYISCLVINKSMKNARVLVNL